VNTLIGRTLSEAPPVKVWVATPEPLAWGGLPVDTAADLEAGLIQMMRPLWTIMEAV
jgi:hypothetical protein